MRSGDEAAAAASDGVEHLRNARQRTPYSTIQKRKNGERDRSEEGEGGGRATGADVLARAGAQEHADPDGDRNAHETEEPAAFAHHECPQLLRKALSRRQRRLLRRVKRVCLLPAAFGIGCQRLELAFARVLVDGLTRGWEVEQSWERADGKALFDSASSGDTSQVEVADAYVAEIAFGELVPDGCEFLAVAAPRRLRESARPLESVCVGTQQWRAHIEFDKRATGSAQIGVKVAIV